MNYLAIVRHSHSHQRDNFTRSSSDKSVLSVFWAKSLFFFLTQSLSISIHAAEVSDSINRAARFNQRI